MRGNLQNPASGEGLKNGTWTWSQFGETPPSALPGICPSRGESGSPEASRRFNLNRKMRVFMRHMRGMNQALSIGAQAIHSNREFDDR
jgi:hypothetical protein